MNDDLVIVKCHICNVFLNIDFAKRAKMVAQPNELFGQIEKMMTTIKEPDEVMRRIYAQVQPQCSEQLMGVYVCESCEKELRTSKDGCHPTMYLEGYPDAAKPDEETPAQQ